MKLKKRPAGPHEYPKTVSDVLDDGMTFNPATLRAMRKFKASKPWQGTFEQRAEKLCELCTDLAAAYNIRRPRLLIYPTAGMDCYTPSNHTIYLHGGSVVTFLHEFGHARGYGERRACRWSINLFRRIFPNSFARLEQRGHCLVRPGQPGHDDAAPS